MISLVKTLFCQNMKKQKNTKVEVSQKNEEMDIVFK